MTFCNAVKSFYANYATFTGRSSRSAYWWVELYQLLVLLPLALIAIIGKANADSNALLIIGMALIAIFAIANIVPGIALAIRRLHDTNRSGWWYLINFIPYIGSLWFFVLTLLPSTQGPNNYGETNGN